MKEEKEKEKELDIRDVFSAIGNFFEKWFKSIGRTFLRSILFLKKNKKFIGGLTMLGIIGGLAYSLMGEPYYTATMVIKSNDKYLEKNIFIKILDELNTMCSAKDYSELARSLNISVEDASAIRAFKLEEQKEISNMGSYYKKYQTILSTVTDEAKRDELLQTFIQSEKDNIYYISVSAYNDSVIPLLNEPIEKLVNNSPYFIRKRDVNKIVLETTEQVVYGELEKLDSLKKTLTAAIERSEKSAKSGSNNIIFGEQQLYNPLPVYDKYLTLHSEVIELKRQLLSNDYAVEVLSGFVKLARNARPGPLISSLVGAGAGFACGILFVISLLGIQRFNALEEKDVE